MELDHLKKTFVEINNFPEDVVNHILRQISEEQNRTEPPNIPNENNTSSEEKVGFDNTSIRWKKGEKVVKEIKKHLTTQTTQHNNEICL